MKNKNSFLEKFLWNLYEMSEEIIDLLKYVRAPTSWKEVLHPEYRKLKREYEKRMGRKAFRNLIYYLKKKGIIKGFKEEKTNGWLLTEKGKEKILKIKEKIDLKNLKKRKDGKWIMVIFDIPEKEKNKRDFFRWTLQTLGFQMLQKSIWISPHDVLEKVKTLIKNHFLKSYVKLLIIEEIQLQS